MLKGMAVVHAGVRRRIEEAEREDCRSGGKTGTIK